MRKRGFLAVLLMVCSALVLGGVTATTASYLGWRLSTPSPDADEAGSVLQLALPGSAPQSSGWHDDVHDYEMDRPPTGENLPGQWTATYGEGQVGPQDYDAALTRLRDLGWEVSDETEPGDTGRYAVASRGDLVTEWEFSRNDGYQTPHYYISVWLWHYPPTLVKLLIVAGWLLGGALGRWWAVLLLRRPPIRAHRALTALTGIAITLLGPSTVFAAIIAVQSLLDIPGRNGQPVAMWLAYFPFLLPFGFQIG